MVPKNSVPMDKWSPTNLVPMDKWSLEYSVCPGGQAVMIWKYGDQIGCHHMSRGTKFDGDRLSRGTKLVGDHLSMGTKFFGDHLSMGTKFWGTICPWGPNFGGPFVHGDRKWGTGSPGIKWVRNQMSSSRGTLCYIYSVVATYIHT